MHAKQGWQHTCDPQHHAQHSEQGAKGGVEQQARRPCLDVAAVKQHAGLTLKLPVLLPALPGGCGRGLIPADALTPGGQLGREGGADGAGDGDGGVVGLRGGPAAAVLLLLAQQLGHCSRPAGGGLAGGRTEQRGSPERPRGVGARTGLAGASSAAELHLLCSPSRLGFCHKATQQQISKIQLHL